MCLTFTSVFQLFYRLGCSETQPLRLPFASSPTVLLKMWRRAIVSKATEPREKSSEFALKECETNIYKNQVATNACMMSISISICEEERERERDRERERAIYMYIPRYV